MSIHSAPPASRSAREGAWDHPDEDWDDDVWDDESYDGESPGRILWGRVAAFGLILLLAFLAGRMTAGDGSAEALAAAEARADELSAELTRARNEIDALAAGGADEAPADPEAAADSEADSAAASDASGETAEDAAAGDGQAEEESAETAQAEPAEESPATEPYTVQPGDNLFGLAEQFYGDGQQWRQIAEANDLGAGAVLTPGQTLEIPTS